MKRSTKKEPKGYSFDEYIKRFPTPPPPDEREPIEDNPSEMGAKLAEQALAKVRAEAKRT
jgi:hypothetical protein